MCSPPWKDVATAMGATEQAVTAPPVPEQLPSPTGILTPLAIAQTLGQLHAGKCHRLG